MAESGWIRGAGPPGRRWVPLSALSWLVSAALREVEGERQLGGRRPRWQRGCQRRRKPEVPENAADHLRIVDRGDQAEAATAGPASENVKLEHPAQKVGPLEPPTGFPRSGSVGFEARCVAAGEVGFAVRGDWQTVRARDRDADSGALLRGRIGRSRARAGVGLPIVVRARAGRAGACRRAGSGDRVAPPVGAGCEGAV